MSNDHFPTGKLPLPVLEELLGRYATPDERLIVGPQAGEDAAVIDFGDRYLVAKTDPITFATDEIGWYAVHVNANDVAVMGARPRWFLATLLLPEGQANKVMAETIVAQIDAACRSLGIALAGGHTEITHGLDRPLVIGTMLGEVAPDRLVTTSGAQVGDAILLIKPVPIEGTAIIARERAADLAAKGYDPALIARAQNFLHDPGISVVRAARRAVELAPVHAMHDPTEGGVVTGLLELARAAGTGLWVDLDRIPVPPEAAALCSEYGLDPLGTIASGALLLTLPAERAEGLRAALAAEDMPSVVIGQVLEATAGLQARRHGGAVPWPTFAVDEIARLF
ncbi:MAG: hydrogenase expression/formation protein [Chloroflexi bacterium]|nr:hydrogenase expression/formation protein [Chloroflexota bacterium]